MTDYYDRQGKRLSGMNEWGKLHAQEDYKMVAKTKIGDCLVSTVWLGMNHRWGGDGLPLIFETMIFGPGYEDANEFCERYSTEEEAVEGHAKICIALDEHRTFSCVADLADIHVDFDDDEFSSEESNVIEI